MYSSRLSTRTVAAEDLRGFLGHVFQEEEGDGVPARGDSQTARERGRQDCDYCRREEHCQVSNGSDNERTDSGTYRG